MSETKAERPKFFVRITVGSDAETTFDVHSLTYDEVDRIEEFLGGKSWMEVLDSFDAGTLRARDRMAIVGAGLIRSGAAKSFADVVEDISGRAFAEVSIKGLGADPTPPAPEPESKQGEAPQEPKSRAKRTSSSSQSATA